jgi:hypothetical protein
MMNEIYKENEKDEQGQNKNERGEINPNNLHAHHYRGDVPNPVVTIDEADDNTYKGETDFRPQIISNTTERDANNTDD